MFEEVSGKLYKSISSLKGKQHISPENINHALKEVKISLLEADVNYRVVNSFLKHVKGRAMGDEVIHALSPSQQFIKVVHEELTSLMGGEQEGLIENRKGLTVTMLIGLQGSGKTTTCGKLANLLKQKNAKPYLVPLDIYRPAAIEQLHTLANDINVLAYPTDLKQRVSKTAELAIQEALEKQCTHLILDTAGRLQIDEEMMQELLELKNKMKPNDILLVADAMSGQEALNVAKTFNNQLNITGLVLTKTDGDARGGAALSMRAITECPIKFIGTGEKISDIETFYPERTASKILGMGDMLTLIEKAEQTMSVEEAKRMEEKFRKNQFTLLDFKNQISQIKKMGSIGDILKMMPGFSANMPQNMQFDDDIFKKISAIISSMTKTEQNNEVAISSSRRQRIAKGSGTSVQDVAKMLKQFNQMKSMMKKFSGTKSQADAMKEMKKMMKNIPGGQGIFG